MSRYRAVIFDMDGTIVDNMRFHADVWATLAARLGEPISAERFEREFAGKKNEEILQHLAPGMSAAEMQRLADEKEALYRAAYAPSLAPMPGFLALLGELRAHGMPCLVATAAPLENRDFILDGLALRSAFDAVVGAESVARGKPHPDIFLRAAASLALPAEACLVFEDALNGVHAARAAGMDAVGVLTTTSAGLLQAAGARWTLPDYTRLPTDLRASLGLSV